MTLLAAIFIFVVGLLTMVGLRVFRPFFAYHWLIAAAAVLTAWPLILLARIDLPRTVHLISYQPGILFPTFPILLIDSISWPYAVALGTLALAVILTDVARAAEADWGAWAGSLGLIALGLLAVLAGNPLTLILAWTAIDLAEVLILLGEVRGGSTRERVIVAFSTRLLGTLILAAAGLAARAEGHTLSFALIPPASKVLLILAAGMRLGLLPLHLPFLTEPPLRRGLGTITRLVPAAASLVLLARTAAAAEAGSTFPFQTVFLALAVFAGLFGGFYWATARDELDGRPAWILGMTSLALGATIQGDMKASLAWGLGAIYAGSLLFLLSTRHLRLIWVLVVGFLSVTSLPFSPTWQGSNLYSGLPVWGWAFLIVHVLLLTGYLRHSFRTGDALRGVERWVWLIYPAGLIVLPATHLFNYFWLGGIEAPGLWNWIAGFLALALGVGLFYYERTGPFEIGPPPVQLTQILSFGWLYQGFWMIYRYLGRLVGFISAVLEGEGGLLWAMLVLVLLLGVLARAGGGG